MKRILLGGIVGGIVLFVWGMLSHEVLPLGKAGIRTMPPEQETAVLDAMRGAMRERAIYIFPGVDMSRKMTSEEQKAWQERYAAGPAGIVSFDPHPGGDGAMLVPKLLGKELAFNILAALVAAILISNFSGALGYGKCVLLGASLGVLVTLDVDASYWNWYSFPTSYALAQLADHTCGWLVTSLVLVRICARRAR